jgi:AcrR family transcriptional regulator
MSAAKETTERILDAASKLIAARGYAATTTRAIAEEAGLNEVTLFRRFTNKAGVLAALFERIGARTAGKAAAASPEDESAREALLRMARSEIAGAVDDGGVALRLAFEARSVPEVAGLMGDAPRRNLAALATFMVERQSRGELRDDLPPEVLAEAFFSLTSSFVMYRMVVGPADGPLRFDGRAVEQLFEIFWAGASRPARARQASKGRGRKADDGVRRKER